MPRNRTSIKRKLWSRMVDSQRSNPLLFFKSWRNNNARLILSWNWNDAWKIKKEIQPTLINRYGPIIRGLPFIFRDLATLVGNQLNSSAWTNLIQLLAMKLHQGPVFIDGMVNSIVVDNSRPHKSLKKKKKLAGLKYDILPHPPYSPDLSPTDYHLFRHYQFFYEEKNI